jgi:hypothetical protein
MSGELWGVLFGSLFAGMCICIIMWIAYKLSK